MNDFGSETAQVSSTDQLRREFWAQIKHLPRPPLDLATQLTRSFLRAAQAEHASIASFAKFSLELLAVGAPPQLLEQAHKAALDEIEHARICFALASHFSGQPFGPGPLPLELTMSSPTLLEVTRDTVRDGCINETLAACEAQAAAERTTVPTIALALTIIAEDETAHAELAWRFVGWALGQAELSGLSDFHSALDATFRQAVSQARHAPGATVFDSFLPDWGRLPSTDRVELRAQVLRDHIEPTWTSLVPPRSAAP